MGPGDELRGARCSCVTVHRAISRDLSFYILQDYFLGLGTVSSTRQWFVDTHSHEDHEQQQDSEDTAECD